MRHLLTVDRIAAALVWLALTTVTALGQIAPDPNQGGAITPVIGSAVYWERVPLPMLARYAR